MTQWVSVGQKDNDADTLRSMAGLATPTGRVLLIEGVGGRLADSESDLCMLVIFGGRERRLDEFRALASSHGLVLDAVTDLTEQRRLLEFRPVSSHC